MTHRYLGVVMGLLMLMWFLSGIVMLFVHWPEVRDEERTAGLPPIRWEGCCVLAPGAAEQLVTGAVVEDLANRPVLRADGHVIDLTTGAMIHDVPAGHAASVAVGYLRATGARGTPGQPERIARDQWTVTGYFDSRRPFWVFHFNDWARTDVYVSARTGQVAQATTRWERLLNWFGPIPHWLYPQVLRADTKVWAQVVIWTSLTGLFLTVTGLYLGVVAWRPWRNARVTPYRGLMAWHHLAGLAAGVLTLTWVASGLLSMNPWGLLESQGDPRAARVAGDGFTQGDLVTSLTAAKAAGVIARQVRAAPLGGKLHLMADGVRLDAQARPAPLVATDLAAAARRLGPAQSAGMITTEDAYYYGHHDPVSLPVYRVIMPDGVRFYLDPKSGQVLGSLDGAARSYRWLFEGLHRLDVIRGFDRGAGWATAMTALLAFAGLGVATGVWLGWRRIQADVSGLASPRGRRAGL